MHQVAAKYWNKIAETQPLATTWAKRMFSLQQNELDNALDYEEARLARETNDPVLAVAYLKVMPLLWEEKAISEFLLAHPSLMAALMPIASVSDALFLAGRDFCLSNFQLRRLSELLEIEPDTRDANSPFDAYAAALQNSVAAPINPLHVPDPELDSPDSWSKKLWAEIPALVRKDVERHVLARLPPDTVAHLRDLHARGIPISSDPAFFHFGGGLAVRNLCREQLTDGELANYCLLGAGWDSCYIGVLSAIAENAHD